MVLVGAKEIDGESVWVGLGVGADATDGKLEGLVVGAGVGIEVTVGMCVGAVGAGEAVAGSVGDGVGSQ